MKRIVLLVPDELLVRTGSSASTRAQPRPVTAELLCRVLGPQTDYHASVAFPHGSVQVLGIEDADGTGDEEATIRTTDAPEGTSMTCPVLDLRLFHKANRLRGRRTARTSSGRGSSTREASPSRSAGRAGPGARGGSACFEEHDDDDGLPPRHGLRA